MRTKSKVKKNTPKFVLSGVLPQTGENFMKETDSLDKVKEAGVYMVIANNVGVGDGLPDDDYGCKNCFNAQLIVTCSLLSKDSTDAATVGQMLIISNRERATTSVYTRSWEEQEGNTGEWTPWLMLLGGDISVVAPSNELAGKVSVLSDKIDKEVERALAADAANCDAIARMPLSLGVRTFYNLEPHLKDDTYALCKKVTLSVLDKPADFYRIEILTREDNVVGNLSCNFYCSSFNTVSGVPQTYITYIYVDPNDHPDGCDTRYQLFDNTKRAYIVGATDVYHLNPGWNKLTISHTYTEEDKNTTFTLFFGKYPGVVFYLYKILVFNGVNIPATINPGLIEDVDMLVNDVDALKDVSTGLAVLLDKVYCENETFTVVGDGNSWQSLKKVDEAASEGETFEISCGAFEFPDGVAYKPNLQLRFYDSDNTQLTLHQFLGAAGPTRFIAPEGTSKVVLQFYISTASESIEGENYIVNNVTFKKIGGQAKMQTRIETVEKEVALIKSDWNGKILSTYGDSVTALQNGDFSYPYSNIDTTTMWGNRVAQYLGFSKHYGRGIGGQKYAWGNAGGSVSWIYKETGILFNRNDAFNLDNWDGATFPETWSDEQKNTVLSGLADGTILSVRGCGCSWLRITSMYPESIKDTIDAVFVQFHNDGVDGTELQWVEGDTIDPEWATSEYYASYGGDYNITTLQGGIASAIMKLQAWMPQAIIILGTPISGRANGSNASELNPALSTTLYGQCSHVKNVASQLSIPVIDVYGTCGINGLNRTKYITDTIHPYSVAGSKMIARAVIAGMKNILPF